MPQYELEELRIRSTYAHRDSSGKPSLYAWHRQEVLLNQYRFRAVAASLLKGCGFMDLSHTEVLDVGCGSGGWLRTLMEWGAHPERLHGIDLLQDRIDKAKSLGGRIDYQIASGYEIPFPDASMDLVSAHTVFSSILDGSHRKALSEEMIRILRPEGKILIYDYRISDPRNPDTVGICKSEIRRLFPSFKLEIRSLTLAPPILRKIASVSPLLTHALEILIPFLRTHAIYFLRR
jgi:SAM-dependent methyltransferase